MHRLLDSSHCSALRIVSVLSSSCYQLFLEVHGEETIRFCRGQAEHIECLSDEKNKLFFLELLLHISDISNPYKPFVICEQWADLVALEFFQQGDKEAALGLDISPMMDRKNSNLFNMQLGFIEFVVSPLLNCTSIRSLS